MTENVYNQSPSRRTQPEGTRKIFSVLKPRLTTADAKRNRAFTFCLILYNLTTESRCFQRTNDCIGLKNIKNIYFSLAFQQVVCFCGTRIKNTRPSYLIKISLHVLNVTIAPEPLRPPLSKFVRPAIDVYRELRPRGEY